MKHVYVLISGIAIFLFMVLIGFFLPSVRNSPSDPRLPASIPKQEFDFTYLEAGALNSALSRSVLKDAQLLNKDNGTTVGVVLGNFRGKTAGGAAVSLCETYDRVSLSFHAEGQADSGERASLTITGPCQVTDNSHLTSPIWIPVAKIRSHEPTDFEESWVDGGEISVKAKDIGFAWPEYWVLAEVKLSSSSDATKQLSLDRYSILKHSTHPLTLLWR